MKNFIIRTITGVLFVAAIVTCFLRAEAMILLFALVTGLTIWSGSLPDSSTKRNISPSTG